MGSLVRRLPLVLLLLLAACPRKTRYRERAERAAADERARVSTISEVGLTVVFFDLGQADAMLVVHDGHTLLMDAGESREAQDADKWHRIAARLVELTGSAHVDAFVVSHYHRDHIGDPRHGSGIWGVIGDGVTFDTLYDRGDVVYGDSGKGEPQLDWERAWPEWLRAGKARRHQALKVGDALALGDGLEVKVVAVNGNGLFEQLMRDKPDDLPTWPASENDYSVAFKLTYGDFELYAGGDLSGHTLHRDYKGNREAYHDVESSTAGRVGDVEVYRVNHHGSAHSSNRCFLNVLRPEVSVISAGLNSYGHPTAKAYDPLMDQGRVYITGGSDPRVADHVARSVVAGDVTVKVEKGGARFAVNGRDFRSKSDAEEAALEGHLEACTTAPW